MNRVHILVIDDDEGIRTVVPRMLSALGVTVKTAATLSDAMSLMAERPADFLFLDLRLPDSPNAEKTLQAIHDLKSFNPEAPVVVITGDPDDKLKSMSAALGASAYIRKDDLTGQRDLYRAMRDAISFLTGTGITASEAMTKILNAVNTKLETAA